MDDFRIGTCGENVSPKWPFLNCLRRKQLKGSFYNKWNDVLKHFTTTTATTCNFNFPSGRVQHESVPTLSFAIPGRCTLNPHPPTARHLGGFRYFREVGPFEPSLNSSTGKLPPPQTARRTRIDRAAEFLGRGSQLSVTTTFQMLVDIHLRRRASGTYRLRRRIASISGSRFVFS
ncbi:hypothetical protein CDAR_615981 [Caerostris darwini]|uniref:Uncharacterized protein n=1 Tax=Caerostris darwini TaxID=1538125 RepID=A0AAV4RY81_9ARAC|nr:hypothetical protein CDAR_615981 [Caerostris darwini]